MIEVAALRKLTELGFDLPETYENPFDPDSMRSPRNPMAIVSSLNLLQEVCETITYRAVKRTVAGRLLTYVLAGRALAGDGRWLMGTQFRDKVVSDSPLPRRPRISSSWLSGPRFRNSGGLIPVNAPVPRFSRSG